MLSMFTGTWNWPSPVPDQTDRRGRPATAALRLSAVAAVVCIEPRRMLK